MIKFDAAMIAQILGFNSIKKTQQLIFKKSTWKQLISIYLVAFSLQGWKLECSNFGSN
jgi:hypothetical protein